jgi:hypothetical protein
MNAVAHHPVPQQLSAGTRAGVAFAAVALIAGTVMFADAASEHAVRNAEAALNPAIRYVVLPRVEVTAPRDAQLADACAAPARVHVQART